MLYKELDENIGELKFYGDISQWQVSGEDFSRTLADMEKKYETIHMRVHCYGGSVFEGNVMFNAMLRCKSKIVVYIDGVAASMMSLVMLAGDEIIAAENAFIMIHNPTAFQTGNARQMIETAKLLTDMEKNFSKVYAKKTGKSEKEVQKWFDGADHWFSAAEAKQEGLITDIDSPIDTEMLQIDKPAQNGQEKIIFERFAALSEKQLSISLKETKNNNQQMKKELIENFNLSGLTENSTDAEIQDALRALLDKTGMEAKKQTDEAIRAVISAKEKTTGAAYDQTTIANLIAVGEKMGLSVLQTMLDLTPPAAAAGDEHRLQDIPKIISLLENRGTGNSHPRKDWDWDKWQQEDPDGYQELETSNPQLHKDLYNAKFKTNL